MVGHVGFKDVVDDAFMLQCIFSRLAGQHYSPALHFLCHAKIVLGGRKGVSDQFGPTNQVADDWSWSESGCRAAPRFSFRLACSMFRL
jgi:hypothetical protein